MALDFDHQDMRPERAGHDESKTCSSKPQGVGNDRPQDSKVNLGIGTLRSELTS